jgi:hypothetical protein
VELKEYKKLYEVYTHVIEAILALQEDKERDIALRKLIELKRDIQISLILE